MRNQIVFGGKIQPLRLLLLNSCEKEKRLQIFKSNAFLINGPKKTQRVDIATETSFRYDTVTNISATVDWRKRGAVTPIKDPFSSIHQITTGKLVSFSGQELVDCVKYESARCEGGYVADVFEFIAKKGGIANETHYPYKGVNKVCKVKKESHQGVALIKEYEKVPANSEKELLKAVAHQPVSVYVEAGGTAFQFYSIGIFIGKCGAVPDHTVTVVGYGKARGVTKYCLVKEFVGHRMG
ncbi:Senescence-specific cysteine protease SAG39, partial [Mucuna pruriens]